MTSLTQISTTWIVSEENGERVARPECPIPAINEYYADWILWHDHFQKVVYVTNHTPGSYKSEELGEVTEQCFSPTVGWVDKKNVPKWIALLMETRLYIKSK